MLETQLILIAPMIIVGVILRFQVKSKVIRSIVVCILWFSGFLLSALSGTTGAMGGGGSDGYDPMPGYSWWWFWFLGFIVGLFLVFVSLSKKEHLPPYKKEDTTSEPLAKLPTLRESENNPKDQETKKCRTR
jgi:hypothetical protein